MLSLAALLALLGIGAATAPGERRPFPWRAVVAFALLGLAAFVAFIPQAPPP